MLKHPNLIRPLEERWVPPPTELAPAATSEAAIRAERRIALVRLLVLLSLLPLLWWDVISPATETALVGLTILIGGYVLGALLIVPRLRRAPREDVFLTIDILAATALVVFTGGVESSLLFLLSRMFFLALARPDSLMNAEEVTLDVPEAAPVPEMFRAPADLCEGLDAP